MLVLAAPTFALDYSVSDVKLLPDGGAGSARVKCPNGTHVLSGGQNILAGATDAKLLSSAPVDLRDRDRKPDDGWKVTAISFEPGNTVQVFGVCDRRQPRYVFARKSVGIEGFFDTVRRPCPRRTHVTGGGVRLAGADQGAIYLARSGPFDLGDGNEAPDDGWAARGFNEEGKRDMIVHAICGRENVKYASGSATAPPQGSAEANAVCPGGRPVIGGGIDTAGLGFIAITTSYPPFGDAWWVEADNYFGGGSAAVLAFAICRP